MSKQQKTKHKKFHDKFLKKKFDLKMWSDTKVLKERTITISSE